MGAPYQFYQCSVQLLALWAQPLRRGGLTVEFRVEDDTYREIDGLERRSAASTARWVRSGDAEITILERQELYRDPAQPGHYLYLFVDVFQAGNFTLAALVENAILASGAQIRVYPLACRRLYVLAPAMVACLADDLNGPDLATALGAYLPYSHPDALPVDACFRVGEACSGSVKIKVYAGPAIDPDTGENRYYCALDYGRTRSRSRRVKELQLADRLDLFLQEMRARRIDVEPGLIE